VRELIPVLENIKIEDGKAAATRVDPRLKLSGI
jgi:hypothetical protein